MLCATLSYIISLPQHSYLHTCSSSRFGAPYDHPPCSCCRENHKGTRTRMFTWLRFLCARSLLRTMLGLKTLQSSMTRRECGTLRVAAQHENSKDLSLTCASKLSHASTSCLRKGTERAAFRDVGSLNASSDRLCSSLLRLIASAGTRTFVQSASQRMLTRCGGVLGAEGWCGS